MNPSIPYLTSQIQQCGATGHEGKASCYKLAMHFILKGHHFGGPPVKSKQLTVGGCEAIEDQNKDSDLCTQYIPVGGFIEQQIVNNIKPGELIPITIDGSKIWMEACAKLGRGMYQVCSVTLSNEQAEFRASLIRGIREIVDKDPNFNYKNFMTENGETQANERRYTKYLREHEEMKGLFDRLGCDRKNAGGQQAGDVRFSNGINLEYKSTGSLTIMLNDTLPDCRTVYFIVFTAKGSKSYEPKVIVLPGEEMSNTHGYGDHLVNYLTSIAQLKTHFSNKGHGAELARGLSAYSRPNFQNNIQPYLTPKPKKKSKEVLKKAALELKIKGRTSMDKEQLLAAIRSLEPEYDEYYT